MECCTGNTRKPSVPRAQATYSEMKSLCRSYMLSFGESKGSQNQKTQKRRLPTAAGGPLPKSSTSDALRCQCDCAKRLGVLCANMHEQLEELQRMHNIEVRQLRCEVARLQRDIALLRSPPPPPPSPSLPFAPRGSPRGPGTVEQLLLLLQNYKVQIEELKREKQEAEVKVQHYERFIDSNIGQLQDYKSVVKLRPPLSGN